MAKHHSDLIFCRKQSGIAIGRLCERHDGLCVICDSYVRPAELVRICDECNYGSCQGRCVICGGAGISDAYYCKECVVLEKDVSVIVCLFVCYLLLLLLLFVFYVYAYFYVCMCECMHACMYICVLVFTFMLLSRSPCYYSVSTLQRLFE